MESAPCRQWFLEITMPHKAHHRKGCLPPFSWRYTSRQRRGKNSRKRGRSQQSSFCRNPTIKNTNINQYQISVRVPILGVYTMIHHALSGIGFGFLGFNRHHRPQLYQQLKRVGRCHGPHGGYMREWCWNLGCPKYIKISNNLYKLMIVYDSLWSLVIASPIKKGPILRVPSGWSGWDKPQAARSCYVLERSTHLWKKTRPSKSSKQQEILHLWPLGLWMRHKNLFLAASETMVARHGG